MAAAIPTPARSVLNQPLQAFWWLKINAPSDHPVILQLPFSMAKTVQPVKRIPFPAVIQDLLRGKEFFPMQEKYLQRTARLQYIYMQWVRPQGQWTPWIILLVESSLPKQQQHRRRYSVRDTSNAERSFSLHRAVAVASSSGNALGRNTVEEECFSKTS